MNHNSKQFYYESHGNDENNRFYGGGNEIQRNILSRYVLKLPA